MVSLSRKASFQYLLSLIYRITNLHSLRQKLSLRIMKCNVCMLWLKFCGTNFLSSIVAYYCLNLIHAKQIQTLSFSNSYLPELWTKFTEFTGTCQAYCLFIVIFKYLFSSFRESTVKFPFDGPLEQASGEREKNAPLE